MNDIEAGILKRFEEVKPDLIKWGQFVDESLKGEVLIKLSQKGIIKIFPAFRLKDDESYLLKALYRKMDYHDPLLEMWDKIGTRVVLLKSDQIKKAANLILNYKGWHAEVTKDMQQSIEDQPKQFDYQSFHIVVWPKESWKEPVSTKKEILTCEIQIRTLLQHAFAEVSHDSTYKGVYRNDSEILRHLAKSMALMESTDDYFCKVFDLMADEKREFMILNKELTLLYSNFVPDFNKSEINYDLYSRIFELYANQKVDPKELEKFIQKNNRELKRAIRPKNGLLFQQPIIILIAYYLYNHNSYLKENWPLQQESLKNVYKSFNFSFDQY